MVSLLPVSNSQPTERDPMNSPSTTALGSHMIPTVHWNLTEQLICMWWCQHNTRLAKPMEKKPTSSNSFTPKKSSCSGYSSDGGERLRSCSSSTPLERKRLRWGRASGGGSSSMPACSSRCTTASALARPAARAPDASAATDGQEQYRDVLRWADCPRRWSYSKFVVRLSKRSFLNL
jgi:hypothetical protein